MVVNPNKKQQRREERLVGGGWDNLNKIKDSRDTCKNKNKVFTLLIEKVFKIPGVKNVTEEEV